MFLRKTVDVLVGGRSWIHPGDPTGGGRGARPLMPLLFSLGQHSALEAVQRRLQGNEKVFAYLDDFLVVCSPGRVVEVEVVLRQELRRNAHIDVHQGKTQVWNRLGVTSQSIEELVRVARVEKPDAIVWKGDLSLPRTLQGIRVLGAPIGSPENWRISWRRSLTNKRRCSRCASTRANFWLRMVTPEQTLQFAERHDAAVWECLRAIFGTPQAPDSANITASFPLSMGGLGFTSAVRSRLALVQLGGLH